MVIMTYSFRTNPKLTPLLFTNKRITISLPPRKTGSTPTPLYHGLRHLEVLLSGTVERKSTRAWSWEQTRRTGFKQQCGDGTPVHGNLRVPLKSNGFYTTSHKGRCPKCWIIKTAGWESFFLGGKRPVQQCTYRIPHRLDTNPFPKQELIFGEILPSPYLSTSWSSTNDLHSVRGETIPAPADLIPTNFQISCTFQLEELSFATPFAGHSQERPGGYLSLRCHCSSSFGQTETLHLCRWFDAWWSWESLKGWWKMRIIR